MCFLFVPQYHNVYPSIIDSFEEYTVRFAHEASYSVLLGVASVNAFELYTDTSSFSSDVPVTLFQNWMMVLDALLALW